MFPLEPQFRRAYEQATRAPLGHSKDTPEGQMERLAAQCQANHEAILKLAKYLDDLERAARRRR